MTAPKVKPTTAPKVKPTTTPKAKPTTVAQYIGAAPKEGQKKLREMRACIRAAVPDATENLKWGMPAYSRTRILVMFAGFRHHIGLYPTPSAVRAFSRELQMFATAKGSVQFPLDEPLPLALIRKIVAFRVRESLEQDGKWRTKRRK